MSEHVMNLLLLPDLKTHLEIARANAVIPVPLRLSYLFCFLFSRWSWSLIHGVFPTYNWTLRGHRRSC